MKKVIRLTENDIHRIVKNSIKRILKENENNEMAINRINKGTYKGKVSMDEDDYSVVKKAYHDIIAIMEDCLAKTENWDSPEGEALNAIWRGPVMDLRSLFMNNMTKYEWDETHNGLSH